MLEASQRQIRKAFVRNAKAAAALQGSHDACKGILTFYSVECGLKFIIMNDRGYKSTAEVHAIGHNLRRLLQEAGISPSELASTGATFDIPEVCRESTGEVISISEWHTAWRYGLDVTEKRNGAAHSFLNSVISALQKRVNR